MMHVVRSFGQRPSVELCDLVASSLNLNGEM